MILLLSLLLSTHVSCNPGTKTRSFPCQVRGTGGSTNTFTRNMIPGTEKGEGSCDPNGVCYWDGTAPFCSGSCPIGYEECGRDDCGNGSLQYFHSLFYILELLFQVN